MATAFFGGAFFGGEFYSVTEVATQPSGGWMVGSPYYGLRKLKEEREELGPIPAKVERVIQKVLKQEQPKKDAEAAFRRELTRARLAYKAAYLEILRLDLEAKKLRERQEDDEIAVLLLMH